VRPDDPVLEELFFLRDEVKRLRASLNQLTPNLETLLARRGFYVYKKEPAEDIFIPAPAFLDTYFRMLRKYSFRLFLRDVIKCRDGFTVQDVTRYATWPVTRDYIDFLLSIQMIMKTPAGYVLAPRQVKSFGETLEWYVAEMLRRELGMEAIWGVKFRRPNVGGDYDVIAKFDGSLLYAEVKSSPPKQIYDGEIAAFLDRVTDLAPEIAVFLMDTELRMKDKIVPLFEKELESRYREPESVERIERELFQINGRIFILNAKEDMFQNIQKALYWYYRRSRGELGVRRTGTGQ
jgi:hypothetical protein